MTLGRKRKWALALTLAAAVTGLSLVAYGAHRYYAFYNKIYSPLPERENAQKFDKAGNEKESGKREEEPEEMQPFTLLILGVDSRGKEHGRSDTIMVAAVNPIVQKVTLLSVPRDTRMRVPEHGYEKINHAMAFGGVPLVKESLEEFLEIPIQRYVTVDFEGFRRLVDELGGIQIEVKKRMKYSDPSDGTRIDLKPGLQMLNGEEALGYARYRKSDIGPDESDFQRIKRQQEVIRAVAERAREKVNLFNFFEYMEIAGDHIRTDLNRREIEGLVRRFRNFSADRIDTVTLKGEDKYLPYGRETLYFYVVSDEERERVGSLLEAALNVKEENGAREEGGRESGIPKILMQAAGQNLQPLFVHPARSLLFPDQSRGRTAFFAKTYRSCREGSARLRLLFMEGREGKIHEERIVQEILSGDRGKYALLIERYKQELYRLVYAILRHPKDAEDVLQETFVQIFLSLSTYEGRGLKTWMARIAVNKAIDYKRKRKREREEPLPAEKQEFVGERREPDRDAVGEKVIAQEQLALVRRRIEELPEAYRDVVKAYYLQGKSYKEIAEETGLAVKSVESRLYRAKQWLRRHWKEEDFW